MASIAVALGCLYLAGRDVSPDKLLEVLSGASLPLVLLAGALSLAMNAVKCTKLKVLLSNTEHRVRYSTLFAGEMIAVLIDVAFPFRLTELVKAYVVGRREGIRPSLVLGVEVVEKGVEVLFLLAVLFGLWLARPVPSWVATCMHVGLVAVGLAGVVLALVIKKPAPLERLLEWLGGARFPGAGRISESLRLMLSGMRLAGMRPIALFWIACITAVEWAFLAATFWTTARAVGLSLPVDGVLGVLVATFLAFAVPTSSAGSVGIFELAGKTTLVLLLGMDPGRALGLVILYHGVMVGFGALGGVIGLLWARMSLSEIRGQQPEEDKP